MANYITMSEMIEMTGLDIDAVDSFTSYITNAQVEFERRCLRTFDGTEDDYSIAQRALAFLVAYYIRLHRQETEYAEAELKEYNRLLKLVMIDKTPDRQSFWEPQVQTITQDDMGDTSR